MTSEVSLSHLLGAEHHRLEALWNKARAALGQAASSAALKAFDGGLRRHIRDEEEVLFPAFETRTGMGPQAGPTAVMRLEHRQLETLLAAMAALAGRETTTQAAAALSRLIADHDAKEEGMLYPMMDRVFKAADKSALLSRLDGPAEPAQN